jgi:hypothetical protein
MAKRFNLVRDDHDSHNEPGVVAEGVVFESGKVVINWTSKPSTIATYDSLADLMVIQNKNGITRIQWMDNTSGDARPRPAGIHKLRAVHEQLSEMLGRSPKEESGAHGDLVLVEKTTKA